MHILLTDVATCPRCGPSYGLILLAEEMADRRVREGWLGCPNCREQYPVRGAVGDLRFPPGPPLAAPPAPPADAEAALRLAALMGVAEGPGMLLLVGQPAALAGEVAALVPEVEVVAVGVGEVPPAPASPGAAVTRLVAGAVLPLRGRSVRAVAVCGGAGEALLAEAGRVLGGPGRLVVVDAPAGTAQWLGDHGFVVHLEQDAFVVASPGGAR